MLRRLLILAVTVAVLAGLTSCNAQRKRGRIEGVLLIDGQPAPKGVEVACKYLEITRKLGPGRYAARSGHQYATTNTAGRFVFRSVPDGEVMLGRVHASSQPTENLQESPPAGSRGLELVESERMVTVPTGGTAQVTLGVGVVPVRGRLILPQGATVAFGGANLRPNRNEPVPPDDLAPAEHEKWRSNFYASIDGWAYLESKKQEFYLTVSDSGEVAGNIVVPGAFTVEVFVEPADGSATYLAESQVIKLSEPVEPTSGMVDLGDIAVARVDMR